SLFSSLIPPPPISTLFPYTTLFRSRLEYPIIPKTCPPESRGRKVMRAIQGLTCCALLYVASVAVGQEATTTTSTIQSTTSTTATTATSTSTTALSTSTSTSTSTTSTTRPLPAGCDGGTTINDVGRCLSDIRDTLDDCSLDDSNIHMILIDKSLTNLTTMQSTAAETVGAVSVCTLHCGRKVSRMATRMQPLVRKLDAQATLLLQI